MNRMSFKKVKLDTITINIFAIDPRNVIFN
jgi:hypothetical protein